MTKEEKNKKHGHCGSFKTHEICIKSDDSLPTDQWVHVAAVYDGQKATLYVDSEKQRDTEAISGNVKKSCAHLFLGGIGFTGMMEEARISNTARANFGGTIRETVLRQFFYSGWSCLEEREKVAPEGGSFGTEKVTRQFVEGANIDEHICVDYYGEDGTAVERTLWYHQNARGDVVALTDVDGEIFVELRYSSYGLSFKINEQGQLEKFCDFSVAVFGFQGLTFDEETKLYYVRNRYFSTETGRWLSRDPLGYVDGLNLYEAFGGSPHTYSDPLGDRILLSGLSDTQAKKLRISLQEKTGLQLVICPRTRELTEIKGSSVGEGSAFYREYLRYLIHNMDGSKKIGWDIIVETTEEDSEAVFDDIDENKRKRWVRLNFPLTESYAYSSNDIGMVFAHETYHTFACSDDSTIKGKIESGSFQVRFGTVDFVNVIRYQLNLDLKLNYGGGMYFANPSDLSKLVFVSEEGGKYISKSLENYIKNESLANILLPEMLKKYSFHAYSNGVPIEIALSTSEKIDVYVKILEFYSTGNFLSPLIVKNDIEFSRKR